MAAKSEISGSCRTRSKAFDISTNTMPVVWRWCFARSQRFTARAMASSVCYGFFGRRTVNQAKDCSLPEMTSDAVVQTFPIIWKLWAVSDTCTTSSYFFCKEAEVIKLHLKDLFSVLSLTCSRTRNSKHWAMAYRHYITGRLVYCRWSSGLYSLKPETIRLEKLYARACMSGLTSAEMMKLIQSVGKTERSFEIYRASWLCIREDEIIVL